MAVAMALLMWLAGTAAAADTKYLKSVAQKVRAIHPEMFDATTPVPDSVARDHDAVIIAELDYVGADYENHANATRPRSITKRFVFTRKMVKILNAKGVEEMSQHEFGGGSKVNVEWIKLADFKNGFGATVHKPDGRVIEVDLSEAVNVTTGKADKKKNTVKSKIDIPGLEPGDVLDYFESRDEWLQEFDLDPVVNTIPSRYPVMKMKVEYVLHPGLTSDWHAYNGAPAFSRATDSKGHTVLTADFTDVPVVTDRKYMRDDRQIPFYHLNTLNFQSPYRKYITQRQPGVTSHLQGKYYINILARDIFSTDPASSGIGGAIMSLVRDYAKRNPEATPRDLRNIAWAAAHYVNRTHSSGGYGASAMSIILADALGKKPLMADSVRVALINPRSKVPIDAIPSTEEASFAVRAGGNLYLMSSPDCTAPGEIPAAYQGETGFAYPLSVETVHTVNIAEEFTAPSTKANAATVATTLAIGNLDDIHATGTVYLKGAAKSLAAGFNSEEEIDRSLEQILGIPAGKRYTPKTPYETAEEAQERILGIKTDLEGYLFADDDCKVESYDITSNGLNPQNPLYIVEFSAAMPAAVTRAGRELVLPVGKFAGDYRRLSGHDRERQTDIYLPWAGNERFTVSLDLPEGYTADPASLEALTSEVSNAVGSVVTQAVATDEGSVSLVVFQRLYHSFLPIGAWPMLLELLDARAAVADATLILTPVKP